MDDESSYGAPRADGVGHWWLHVPLAALVLSYN